MPIDPVTGMLIAQGGGELLDMPFKIWGGIEQIKNDRAQLREAKKTRKWRQLMDVVQGNQQIVDKMAGARRLMALRNAGRTA